MKVNEHLFWFKADAIAAAAYAERDYHRERLLYWRGEQERLVALAKGLTAVVKVIEQAVTGGIRVQVVADLSGAQELNWKLNECGSKIDQHRAKADEYGLKAAAYASQPDRAYELDPQDVAYFRLAGGPREP